MSDLERIEARHWHDCPHCGIAEDGSVVNPCDAVKLARALDEMLMSSLPNCAHGHGPACDCGGELGRRTLAEVAGGEK